MGDGVDLFGIAGAHCNGFGALKIAIDFIMACDAVAAAK
jgi:hypothetical protein